MLGNIKKIIITLIQSLCTGVYLLQKVVYLMVNLFLIYDQKLNMNP